MLVPLVRDGGFWKRFPMPVQPLGAEYSALLQETNLELPQIIRTPSIGLDQFLIRETP